MDESENTFPMDFYVETLATSVEVPAGGLLGRDPLRRRRGATRGVVSVSHGFASPDVKLYTGEQILENYEVYLGRRNATDRVVGSLVDDSEGKELYLAYAGEDRCAMWVRIPDESDVPKALRVLADHDYVHTRYYGSDRQTDYNVS